MKAPASANLIPAGRAILWGGLLAGTFDLAFAFVYYGLKIGVLQSIAAGLLGRPTAVGGGLSTALLGLILHYLIAFIWTGLFWVASRWFSPLVRYAVPAGLIYGLIVFYGMNSVVLPLSALQTKAWPLSLAPWPIAVHLLLVGLPIALAVRKFSRSDTVTTSTADSPSA